MKDLHSSAGSLDPWAFAAFQHPAISTLRPTGVRSFTWQGASHLLLPTTALGARAPALLNIRQHLRSSGGLLGLPRLLASSEDGSVVEALMAVAGSVNGEAVGERRAGA